MTRRSSKDRIAALEAAIAQVSDRLDSLEKSVADRAPASEIERLNHAFDLIADRPPASEIERLNYAFELIAERAPLTEVERLNHAFELIADRAPASEVERMNQLFELIGRASERSVEVPWVLGKYRGERRVLEVGYAFAEEHYLRALVELEIPFLVGVDAAPSPRSAQVLKFHQVRSDILHPCFAAETFDLILCVSTIEHIGRDNTRYGLDQGRQDPHPDHVVIQAMADWLAPAGRLLLTVPFGRFEDHGWLINYDMDRLEALIKASELDVEEMSFYGWQPGGWGEVQPEALRDRGYRSLGAAHAAGVALVELRRGEMS
jgi:O-antigen chain-terminating methyltransferase